MTDHYTPDELTVDHYQDDLHGDVLKVWPTDQPDAYKMMITAKEDDNKDYDTLPEAITAYRNSSMENPPTGGDFDRCTWHQDGTGVCEKCSEAAYDAAEDWVAERADEFLGDTL